MNFLLHRHLGARDLGSTVAGVGSMLPDLWRMADRGMRPSERIGSDGVSDATTSHLLHGVRHHLVADRWFHTDEVFIVGERTAVDLLRDAKLAARHSRLFGHVLWELCLDGELVRREGSQQVLEALRDGFDRAGAALREVAERHRRDRSGHESAPDERRKFELEMNRICDALARGPWVAGYASGEGIAARIGGVRARLGLDPLEAEDNERLARVADALLERAVPALSRIVAWKPIDGR